MGSRGAELLVDGEGFAPVCLGALLAAQGGLGVAQCGQGVGPPPFAARHQQPFRRVLGGGHRFAGADQGDHRLGRPAAGPPRPQKLAVLLEERQGLEEFAERLGVPARGRQRFGQGVPAVREPGGAVGEPAVDAHAPLREQDGVAAVAGRRPQPGQRGERIGLAQLVVAAAALFPGRGELPLRDVVLPLVEGDEAARIRGAEPREGIAGAVGQLLGAPRLALGLGALAQREVRLGQRDPGPAFRPCVTVPGRPRRHRPGSRLVRGGQRPGVRRHLGEQQEIGGLADDPRGAQRGTADEGEQPRSLLRPGGQGAVPVLRDGPGAVGGDAGEVVEHPVARAAEGVHLPPHGQIPGQQPDQGLVAGRLRQLLIGGPAGEAAHLARIAIAAGARLVERADGTQLVQEGVGPLRRGIEQGGRGAGREVGGRGPGGVRHGEEAEGPARRRGELGVEPPERCGAGVGVGEQLLRLGRGQRGQLDGFGG
ncbi:hypothetical protein BG653_06822 [Streptomyces platensis]|uniref:Uncharacterized protein n=1 Tax=Streptomyces platensis TaxID=58346 RepID=A0ABX3XMU9_STRPT|nr:hypothetical protein BG653_06822 [Streptomyces platensis]